ncbi:MAG: GNAT family N-acetyltransferase [Anaerolineales bacterium]|jgi:ribosomal protein S18 acetylase RimI-like enzyme
MNEIEYNIRTALSTDRSRLANLIHFGAYIHQHLDWKPPLDWIGSKPYLLMEKEGELFATLACPPDLPEMTWIRLFAVNSLINIGQAWQLLWDATKEELSRVGKIRVAAISLQSWFNDLLETSKFEHTDNVIVLMWEGSTPIPEPATKGINIRPMMPEDLEVIEEIDHDAFGSVWKNSLESLELAFGQASLADVAEYGDEIVGYQYSTSSSMGGHLARLAVITTMQGKGIGYLLVHQLLSQFSKQGIKHVTVNTQQNNVASLGLYSKAGFTVTGESYRVYLHNHNQ